MIGSVWGFVKYCLVCMFVVEDVFRNIQIRLQTISGIIKSKVLVKIINMQTKESSCRRDS